MKNRQQPRPNHPALFAGWNSLPVLLISNPIAFCMKKALLLSCCFVFLIGDAQDLTVSFSPKTGYFPLLNTKQVSAIYYNAEDHKVISIAAEALQNDLFEISGKKPLLHSSGDIKNDYPVIIGTIGNSGFIDALIKNKKLSVAKIAGQWESFTIQVVDHPFPKTKKALVIAGSDRRGTAYGVFELSKRLGVSPWTWWADVHPTKRSAIYIQSGKFIQPSPSVKYRGIFINDEDWGLQPWAAKNMDTDIKDIGPKTYAKVFELLLRLKANYLWPAMHPCTKAFYYYKDNPKVADDYAIVVGASHCEPMLRNNVFEWAENFEHEYGKKPGEWRYDLNGPEIYKYWEDRVKESKNFESVYTIGMRGIHDGSMPGPKDMPGKVTLLQKVIADQRTLLKDNLTNNASTVPQIFCPYKEVLNVYRNGVQLPDDVTVVWADDNHGYIRQLSNEAEQKRSGRSGIYYHLSYWGSPHDYLWLSTISPALISYEMTKAYDYGADRLWVFNVGDIKPAELELQFAMDLAWNVAQWPPQKATEYIRKWAEDIFGKEVAEDIADIKAEYYRLAAEGKPEHLGSVNFTQEQESLRLAAYEEIVKEAEAIKAKIPARLQDAYFQLIYYPVKGAALMNEKIFHAKQSLRPGLTKEAALALSKKATQAFEEIQKLTANYNTGIAGGKWNGMMSWHPRDLPVFKMPKTATVDYLDSVQKAFAKATEQQGLPKGTLPIRAKDYHTKKEFGNKLQTIEGLGVGGSGVSIASFQPVAFDSSLSNTSHTAYQLKMSPGKYIIRIKCLPTQSVNNDGKLLFGISWNDQKPQLLNIHAESESRQWKENVLRGYAEAILPVNATHEDNLLRIYFPEPGFVVNQMEIVQN